MKKIATISLICIYALATMGFSLKEFYCCGKLKTVSLAIEVASVEKCKKGDSTSDDCCKNKFQFFKVKDNHVSASQVILPPQFLTDIDLHFPSFLDIYTHSEKTKYSFQSHAPPLYNGVPVYLSNCIFII